MKDKILSKATLKKGIRMADVMPKAQIERIFQIASKGNDCDVFLLNKVEYESGAISLTIEIKTK